MISISSYFIYSPSSPSSLIWSGETQGRAERIPFTYAGSLVKNIWHVQVTVDEVRYRTTAHRIVWELHHGKIPDNHVIIHKDNDSSNNTIENLSCVTRTQHNLIKAYRSGKPHVRELPSGRFFATIRGYKSLGTYDTYSEAEQVYNEALFSLIKDFI